MERKLQLQQVDLPDVISQLSYTSAANHSEPVVCLEGVMSVQTNQIKHVLMESEQMREKVDNVGPSVDFHNMNFPEMGYISLFVLRIQEFRSWTQKLCKLM